MQVMAAMAPSTILAHRPWMLLPLDREIPLRGFRKSLVSSSSEAAGVPWVLATYADISGDCDRDRCFPDFPLGFRCRVRPVFCLAAEPCAVVLWANAHLEPYLHVLLLSAHTEQVFGCQKSHSFPLVHFPTRKSLQPDRPSLPEGEVPVGNLFPALEDLADDALEVAVRPPGD